MRGGGWGSFMAGRVSRNGALADSKPPRPSVSPPLGRPQANPKAPSPRGSLGSCASRVPDRPHATRYQQLGPYMMVLLQGRLIVVCVSVETVISLCHIGVNIVSTRWDEKPFIATPQRTDPRPHPLDTGEEKRPAYKEHNATPSTNRNQRLRLYQHRNRGVLPKR